MEHLNIKEFFQIGGQGIIMDKKSFLAMLDYINTMTDTINNIDTKINNLYNNCEKNSTDINTLKSQISKIATALGGQIHD